MNKLIFMGRHEDPEQVRCRIYDGEDKDEAKRVSFVNELAGPGVVDCPAYDPWVAALQGKGWLAPTPELEPNQDGPGRIGRWRLTDLGREEWRRMQGK
jgi:hypothetical protein